MVVSFQTEACDQDDLVWMLNFVWQDTVYPDVNGAVLKERRGVYGLGLIGQI